MTRLKIDTSTGTLEVEGEEQFVEKIYNDFKESLADRRRTAVTEPDGPVLTLPTAVNGKTKNKSNSRPPSKNHSYSLIKDLDLFPKDKKSLQDFFREKSPSSFFEKNTVFVYYLQYDLEIPNITPDHVYTCYKTMGEKFPTALRQSLIDVSNKKAYINTSNMGDIRIGPSGENFVEHELPAKSKV